MVQGSVVVFTPFVGGNALHRKHLRVTEGQEAEVEQVHAVMDSMLTCHLATATALLAQVKCCAWIHPIPLNVIAMQESMYPASLGHYA
jgi:hypothetical protein